jgi:hypothetical protein
VCLLWTLQAVSAAQHQQHSVASLAGMRFDQNPSSLCADGPN